MIYANFDDFRRINGIYNISVDDEVIKIDQNIFPSLWEIDYCKKLLKFLKSKCNNEFDLCVTSAQYHQNVSAYNSIVTHMVDYPTMKVELYTQRAYDMYIAFHKLHNYFNL